MYVNSKLLFVDRLNCHQVSLTRVFVFPQSHGGNKQNHLLDRYQVPQNHHGQRRPG